MPAGPNLAGFSDLFCLKKENMALWEINEDRFILSVNIESNNGGIM